MTPRFVLVILCMLVAGAAAKAQTAFYRAPPSAVAGAPGTLIRQEAIDGAPLGAEDLPCALSLDRPGQQADPGLGRRDRAAGRSAAGWQADRGLGPPDFRDRAALCAVAGDFLVSARIQGLRSFVRNGYVVAATDYPGLGTEGPHPYLVGTSEARAVIDSVRVAAGLPGAGGGKKFLVWGHSQGGHAALFTGIVAKAYAPQLELLGVAAAAPATDLVTLMNEDIDMGRRQEHHRDDTVVLAAGVSREYGQGRRPESAASRRPACQGMHRRSVRPQDAPAHPSSRWSDIS